MYRCTCFNSLILLRCSSVDAGAAYLPRGLPTYNPLEIPSRLIQLTRINPTKNHHRATPRRTLRRQKSSETKNPCHPPRFAAPTDLPHQPPRNYLFISSFVLPTQLQPLSDGSQRPPPTSNRSTGTSHGFALGMLLSDSAVCVTYLCFVLCSSSPSMTFPATSSDEKPIFRVQQNP